MGRSPVRVLLALEAIAFAFAALVCLTAPETFSAALLGVPITGLAREAVRWAAGPLLLQAVLNAWLLQAPPRTVPRSLLLAVLATNGLLIGELCGLSAARGPQWIDLLTQGVLIGGISARILAVARPERLAAPITTIEAVFEVAAPVDTVWEALVDLADGSIPLPAPLRPATAGWSQLTPTAVALLKHDEPPEIWEGQREVAWSRGLAGGLALRTGQRIRVEATPSGRSRVVAHVSVSGVFALMVLSGQRVVIEQHLSATRRWLQGAAGGGSCA
jgi:hypothetical protein